MRLGIRDDYGIRPILRCRGDADEQDPECCEPLTESPCFLALLTAGYNHELHLRRIVSKCHYAPSQNVSREPMIDKERIRSG